MVENIEDYIIELLREHRSIDIAEAVFQRAVAESPELKEQFRQWCAETGNTQRYGFRDFCNEYLESENSIWDSLKDYDE